MLKSYSGFKVIILLLMVWLISSCQQKLFPIDSLNTLTIEQEVPLHRKITAVSSGNNVEGVTGTIWHHHNATHKDSVAIWGYVMGLENQIMYQNVIYATIDHHQKKNPFEVQSMRQDSGILHLRIKPGFYDLVINPVSFRIEAFSFNNLDLKGGDSVAFIVVAPESDIYKINNEYVDKSNFNQKLNKQKWHQRLFNPRYLQYYVNGKKVKQKITNNKPVKVKKKSKD